MCVSCVFSACSSLTLSFSRDLEVEIFTGGEGIFFLSHQERGTNKKKEVVFILREWALVFISLPSARAQLCTNCVPRWRGCRESWTTWSNQALWLTRRGWWSRTPGQKSTRAVMTLGWPYSSGIFEFYSSVWWLTFWRQVVHRVGNAFILFWQIVEGLKVTKCCEERRRVTRSWKPNLSAYNS